MSYERFPASGYFIGRYFLRKFPGSRNWYGAWFNSSKGQTGKVSLQTPDLEAAKVELARLVTVHGDLQNARPETVTLAQVFDRYHEHYGKGLPSAAEQKRHMRYWREFFGDDATVADAHPARQQQFVEHLSEHPYGSGYIKRVLASGAAALRWCYRRGELQTVPHVITVADSEPRERILESGEIKALWTAAKHLELRRYIMILLNTACRPEAARDLSVFQVDTARNRIDLNPPGRARTSKGRPVVPITSALLPWLSVEGRDKLIGRGERWLSVGWRAARDQAGLDADVVPYTIRHTVATVLDEANCAEAEIVAFMGWKFTNRMRGWYTKKEGIPPGLLRNRCHCPGRLDGRVGATKRNGPGCGAQGRLYPDEPGSAC